MMQKPFCTMQKTFSMTEKISSELDQSLFVAHLSQFASKTGFSRPSKATTLNHQPKNLPLWQIPVF